jgi:hypothetical protein
VGSVQDHAYAGEAAGELGGSEDCTEQEVRAFAYEVEGTGKVSASLGTWDGPFAEVGGTGSLWVAVSVVAGERTRDGAGERIGMQQTHSDYLGR